MSAPGWLCWIFAAAMSGVALFHLVRLAGPRALGGRLRPDREITHAAAGVAMTLMLLGRLTTWDSRVLIAVFVVPMVWFAVRGTHDYVMHGTAGVAASVQLVIGCAAMAYMLVMPARSGAGSGMAAMPMAAPTGTASVVHSGSLGGLLVAATIGVALTPCVTRLLATTAGSSVTSMFTGVGRSATRAPRTQSGAVLGAAACQLAMNMTTVFMLLAM